MARELKIWNGRGHGKFTGGHIYVAAYSPEPQEKSQVDNINKKADNIEPSDDKKLF